MTDQISFQEPEPYRIPSTGFLLDYDSQTYEVRKTATHVELERDPEGREEHKLEIRIQAVWREADYHQPGMEDLL